MSRVINLLSGGTQASTGDWVQTPGAGQYLHGRATVYIDVNHGAGTTTITLEQSIDAVTAFTSQLLDGVTDASHDVTGSGSQLAILEVEPHAPYIRINPSGGTSSDINVDIVFRGGH